MTALADDDLAALTTMAAAFAQRRLTPQLPLLNETDRLDRGVVADLAGAGLWQLGVPEAAGGQGADLAATVAVAFELAAVSPSIAVAMVHAHAAAHALLATGDAAAGDGQVVITGFTGARPTVRLDLGLGPDRLLIIDAAAGCTSLLPGTAVAPGPAERRCGLAGLGTRLVELDPAALAERTWTGAAHEQALRAAVRWWSAGVAMCALGAASAAVQRAASYAGTRVQFGTTLAAIPVIARSLDELRQAVAGAASRHGPGVRSRGVAGPR
jgi:alkylation response protein AidB-like acyl-CoA dehydrogenase